MRSLAARVGTISRRLTDWGYNSPRQDKLFDWCTDMACQDRLVDGTSGFINRTATGVREVWPGLKEHLREGFVVTVASAPVVVAAVAGRAAMSLAELLPVRDG